LKPKERPEKKDKRPLLRLLNKFFGSYEH